MNKIVFYQKNKETSMNRIYKTVEQVCERYGKHFYIDYSSNGTYSYVGKVCKCDA